MSLSKKIILLCIILFLNGCANYKIEKSKRSEEKIYYSSKGFALIYDDGLFEQGVINKKLDNEKIIAIHSSLKRNTLINIVNPDNLKTVKTKIFRKSNYPKIFNIVVSKKIATILELDVNNPYVEILEVKKNKTFIAKESNTFEEEKNVAEVVTIDEVKMDDLSEAQTTKQKKPEKRNEYVLVISDFYYFDSAQNLMKELMIKTQTNNFSIKKINDTKYRLSVGPFKNFNSLKSIYISLNNLGFEDINIYRGKK